MDIAQLNLPKTTQILVTAPHLDDLHPEPAKDPYVNHIAAPFLDAGYKVRLLPVQSPVPNEKRPDSVAVVYIPEIGHPSGAPLRWSDVPATREWARFLLLSGGQTPARFIAATPTHTGDNKVSYQNYAETSPTQLWEDIKGSERLEKFHQQFVEDRIKEELRLREMREATRNPLVRPSLAQVLDAQISSTGTQGHLLRELPALRLPAAAPQR